MSITKEKTVDLISTYGKNEKDSGSSESQVAILTTRIRRITDHLKENKKDHSGRRGLLAMVSRRRRLLSYIKKNSIQKYQDLIQKLEIRK
ncbi:MAG: 30S ribosomal protein S15 [Candidatus Marinimicrobia bacterium]|jgi:small subunit ribosomal protein S15|nr:30S ribosomal protein S15 [Candidatus Neomarinimicrobiota bacterium]MBT3634413.1 30S ribosomal protein S15 [Candidatus Neomarinimicrobiota bacterium]MBT3683240.1 30S ribosomal protein S15 [Candidatus Neomarinimicrobiota bacterium]MBT3760128.1 30S ribosomal protein S15 [Candidatus Neomarinimicrobiota bacterium]MBT3896223.1 30S ribosomal protein S15 [Candidatus Neomarinimicrobiota bacterium]